MYLRSTSDYWLAPGKCAVNPTGLTLQTPEVTGRQKDVNGPLQCFLNWPKDGTNSKGDAW